MSRYTLITLFLIFVLTTWKFFGFIRIDVGYICMAILIAGCMIATAIEKNKKE